MRKSKNAPKNKLVSYSITQSIVNKIDELMTTGNYQSNSDVVRQAIVFFHEQKYESKKDPGYVAVAKERLNIKKDTISEKQRIEKMSPEEYCTDILNGMIKGEFCYLPNSEFPLHGGMSKVPFSNIK